MTIANKTLDEWAEEFRAAYATQVHLELRIAGCAVRIHSNSPALIDVLGADYHLYAADDVRGVDIDITVLEAPTASVGLPFQAFPPGPGKTVIKDEYCDVPGGRMLRKRLTGMLFLFGDSRHVAVGPCVTNRNQLLNFINNRFIQWNLDRGYVLCHAAGVARGDGGLALAGTSGSGKSTLALDLLAHGCDFVSNDRLMIRRTRDGLQMLGVPKLPRINPGTILHNPRLRQMLKPEERARLEQLPPDDLWRLEQKYDADLERCFGPGRVRLAAPLTGAAILNWRRDGDETLIARVRLEDRRELLQRLIKPLGVHYRVPPDYPEPEFSEGVYIELLRDCPVLEIGGGVSFKRAVEACLELLAG